MLQPLSCELKSTSPPTPAASPVSSQAFCKSSLHTPCKEKRAMSTRKTLHPAASTCCSPVAHACQQVFALSPGFPFGPPCPFFLLPRGVVGTVVLSPGVRFSGSRNRKESVNLPSSPLPPPGGAATGYKARGEVLLANSATLSQLSSERGASHVIHHSPNERTSQLYQPTPTEPPCSFFSACLLLGGPNPHFFLVSPVCLGGAG